MRERRVTGRLGVWVLALWAGASLLALAAKAGEGNAPAAPGASAWVALWQDAYQGVPEGPFDPERFSAAVCVDRTTGEAFVCGWNFGVWKSGDGGRTFRRVDGGKLTGPACGPVQGNSVYASPEGGKIAVFNMWNAQGPSGFSCDGGATWEAFTNVGRDWDFGAMDWESRAALGARHEFDGLHLTVDGGKTWTQLAKSRCNPFLSGLGVLGPATLLTATNDFIERSEDGGKTWTKVSDLGATGPMVSFKGRLWWLSGPRRNSVLTSADQGKTWAVQGEALPEAAVLGPLFGKDENHVVVVTPAGFRETTDGCKSWKLAVAPPEDYVTGGGSGAAFDPVHDVFYVTNWNKPVMKYARGKAPDYAWPSAVLRAKGENLAPRADFVEKPATRGLRCVVTQSMDLCGGFFYVSGEDGILCLKQDVQTGQLALVKQLAEPRSGGFIMKAAGGRLYGVTPHDGYRRMTWHGLAWFEIDPQTGLPARKGVVDCPASRQMVVGPEQKDLYLKSCGKQEKLFWYRLDADGKPAPAGEVTGKGIGANSHGRHPSILLIAPDGKHLYCISGQDYAIACVERKPGGEIAYKGAVDLEILSPRDPANYRYQWVSLGISPDGKWVYASIRNGKPPDNVYGLFKRDPETGALTLQEKSVGDKDRLADMRGWNMVFAPDGSGGYLGSWDGPLLTFRYDPKTGRLSDAAVVKETKGHGSPYLVLDAGNGFLYGGGGDFGMVFDGLLVLKTAGNAAGQPAKAETGAGR